MAAHDAGSPGWSLGKLNGVAPHLSVRNLLPDMFRLVSGVDLVTGLAAPSLCLIHMNEMKISFSIPEISQLLRLWV